MEKAVSIAAEPEEVVAFPGSDELQCGVFDTVAVDDLALLLELLAARAIQSLVLRHVEVIRVEPFDPPQQLGHRPRVPWLRGPDPVVVAALEPSPELLEPVRHAV